LGAVVSLSNVYGPQQVLGDGNNTNPTSYNRENISKRRARKQRETNVNIVHKGDVTTGKKP